MRRAVALAALALAAACGGDDGGEIAEPAATTTSEAPATTTSTTTSTTAPSTTTTTPGPACPAAADARPTDDPPIGILVGEPAPVAAAFDDGTPDDSAATELLGDGWHLVVRFDDGGRIDEVLPSAAPDAVRVRSAVDLDADGTAEVFVQVGTGAAVSVVGLYDLDGCDLEPVLVDGVPAEFAIGGTVLLLQGLACGESDVTHLGATSEDGATYATLDLTYELEGGQLVRVGDETGTLSADDPALAAYSDFAC